MSVWGTPLSVRKKSSAVSLRYTCPPLALTRAGTSTKLVRTVSTDWPASLCCARTLTETIQSKTETIQPDLIIRCLDALDYPSELYHYQQAAAALFECAPLR